jgi:hypothetical protein
MPAKISAREQQTLYRDTMGENALERQRRAGATRCRSCFRPIRWARTGSGKRMPVDYDENEAGNVFLFADGGCRVGKQDEQTPAGATRHFSHFATCPHADEHRR